MEGIIALLRLYGERYINCDNAQAITDINENREEMVGAFNAIVEMFEGAR